MSGCLKRWNEGITSAYSRLESNFPQRGCGNSPGVGTTLGFAFDKIDPEGIAAVEVVQICAASCRGVALKNGN